MSNMTSSEYPRIDREKYRDSVAGVRIRLRYQTMTFGFIHNLLQLIILAGAVAVPFLLNLSIEKIIPTIISLVVAVAAAISNYYKFGERSRNNHQTSEAIRREIVWYDLRKGPYLDLEPEPALDLFVNRIEGFRDEHTQRSFIFEESKQDKKQEQN